MKKTRISQLQLHISYAVGNFLPQGRSSAVVFRRARVLGVEQTAATSIVT